MRELVTHKVGKLNEKLTVRAEDEKGHGGAHHRYSIGGVDFEQPLELKFQVGAVSEGGINGITNEALLAVVLDRLECFQNGPFACHENMLAARRIREAIELLHRRTKKRMNA